MKTTKYTLIAALAIFSAACQNKITPDQTTNEVIFSASIDSPATKVVLGDAYVGSDNKNHYPMLWHGAEKITIFDAEGKNRYFVGYAQERDEENNRVDVSIASVNFKFEDRFEVDGTTFELAEGTTYYAVEPYNSGHKLADGKITQTIAHSQYPNPELGNLPCISRTVSSAGTISYGETAMAALAKTKDTYLSFKPVTALIKFTVGSENVTRVVFKGADPAPAVAGIDVVFDYTGDEPVLESIGTTKTTIYLNNNNEPYTVGATYYIAVLPTTLTPKIGFNFNGSDQGTKYKTGSESITLKPGMILDLGLIEIAAPAAQ